MHQRIIWAIVIGFFGIVNSANAQVNCGKDATFMPSIAKCICKDAGKEFNVNKKACACPDGKQWNGRKCQRSVQ